MSESVTEQTERLFDSVHEKLNAYYIGRDVDHYTALVIVSIITLFAAVLAHAVVKLIIIGVVRRIARHTHNKWDDALVKHKFFSRLGHFAPAIVIYYAADFYPPAWWEVIDRFSQSYIIVIVVMALVAFLNAVIDVYRSLELSRSSPIKGFVQGAKLLIFILGAVFLISTILDKDPWKLVAGIGAVTAVLLLVFKDSILGLVASIQIIANDLIHLGDWIEFPKYGADGDVIDISLTTVKVRNFDNTITTVPTYALISDSFKNWRGMQESNGRRIKRSIFVDMTSIRFLDEELLQELEKVAVLNEYIKQRFQEVNDYNTENKIDSTIVANGRRLTNVGTFRAYLKHYLHHHPSINKEATFLVRQLAPTPHGLPLEIYVFSSDKRWIPYEEIQADIFDHILAVIPLFDLRIFQNPTGSDFQHLQKSN